MASPPKRPRVAVIGAGASGLASLKECLAENLDVVCFEQDSHVGGLWRYVPSASGATGEDTHSSVYMSTIINTSKEMMAYSDFPVPKDWPTFLPHRNVVEYLRLYADNFDLKQHIKFNRKVVSLTPEIGLGGGQTGRWEVVTQKVETFDYVIVATGHHWKPRLPEFNGVEDFKGGLIHSHSYKVPYPFKDQRVLVIGIGNSGADIATELSHHAKVILSSRSGTWILPRFSLFGIPLDHFSSRLAHALPKGVTNFMLETAMRIQHGDLSKFGLNPPTHRVLEAHPTINGHVLDRIASGNVLVRPNVAKFTETAVEFEDGTIEPVDHVIYCTGYRIEHPFLDNALAILGQERADSNRVRLYKHIWPVRHKGIAFVGLVQPIGAVMPVAEMQARWVARVFSGTTTLPTADEMRDRVDVDWTDHQKRYVPKERHTIEVEFVTYMDDLATEVGCKPDLWRLVKASELTLASHLLFGPTVPAQFRLEGPGAWDGARGVIADACAGVIASQPAKKT
ncbi:flavin monooxygenase-like protein [Geranomyces variabilis]|nr:flavin monooxygenase-like protein [Geranomyces variabilis]